MKRKGDAGSSHFLTDIMSRVLTAKATLGCELLKSNLFSVGAHSFYLLIDIDVIYIFCIGKVMSKYIIQIFHATILF